jgi:alanine racemase
VNKLYRCWAEIDLDALRQNLAWIRHRVGKEVKVIAVVKADAYGHGLKQIAGLLMQSGTDVFGVANLAEAASIRSVGQGWPVLMLGACLPEEIEIAVRDRVMPTVSSLAEAESFSKAAVRLGRTAAVHVKIDTGMGRLGVALSDARELIAAVQRLPGLRLAGIYTHYSSVEEDAQFSRQQLKRFDAAAGPLLRDQKLEYVHVNNSAAVLFEPRSIYNTVRPGLLVYGVMPSCSRRVPPLLAQNLRPALTWKSRISFLKTVSAKTGLSYGRSFITRKATRVATITAGYGDGYLRAGSNRAKVLINGTPCRVLGRITMDQMLVDVTALNAPSVGDEVVLLGRQGKQQVRANDVADWCSTVPWEILTNINHRVPRVYLGQQAA